MHNFFKLAESQKFWLLARHKKRKPKPSKRQVVEQTSLPLRIRIGYIVGHVLNDLCASMWFTYLLLFYTAVIGLSHAMTGVIMIIGQIADASATPVVGALSDRSLSVDIRNKFCGKRRGYYIAGTILTQCTIPFIFSPCFLFPNGSEIIKVIYFSFFIILFQFGWAAVQTIHLAKVADLTFNENERTFLLSWRNTMTAMCNCATYIGQWVILSASHNENRPIDSGDVWIFQVLVLAIVSFGCVTSVLFIFLVPEDTSRFRTSSTESSESSIQSIHRPVLATLSKFWLHYIGFIYYNTRIFVVAIQALLTLYLHESLKSLAYELASVPLVLNAVCFLASIACGPITKLIGRKSTFIAGAILGFIASIWTFFGSGDLYRHYLIYLIATLYGIASALMQVTALALIADYIGEDVNNGAFIYGYMSFLDKVSTGVTLALILGFHDKSSDRYLTWALTLTCGISGFLSMMAISIMRIPVRPITPELPEEDEIKKPVPSNNTKKRLAQNELRQNVSQLK